MTILMIIGIVLLVIAVLAALWAVGGYNGLIRLKALVDEGWSGIDVQLKRRYDLIPNLVNTVKGYATHESDTFEKVTAARTAAMSATGLADKGQAENALSGTLKTIFALSESYPELKANQNFIDLQGQLTDTEDKIQAARRFYNGNVRDLNTKIQSFPGNIIAGIFNFAKMDFFNLDESIAERQNVEVKF